MLESLLWILLGGFFAGQIAKRLHFPALLGMMLAGIAIGPQVGDVISAGVLDAADGLRTIAVMVILMKAGLGLDREKLVQQGAVVLRLGWLPALCEAIVVALAAMWLFQFNFLTGLLLGCVVGAESPAVIVPGMLRLKRLGWGVKKGIPDAILTGSALSDVLLLLLFSLLLAFLSGSAAAGLTLPGGLTLTPLQLLPFQVLLQILLGAALGFVAAKGLVLLLSESRWTQNTIQKTLVAAGAALSLVVVAESIPLFSGYLAVMAVGFFLIELDAPLARQLRNGFNGLWVVAEIVLFVLLGASIQLDVLESALLSGLLLLAAGTFVGRSLGWFLSTLGSNWTPKERLFLLPGNSAKATVQAAIGAIPLAQGIEGGDVILAIAALSILVTAPLGAWAIPTFAPKFLEKGEVDPTKVTLSQKPKILAAVDATNTANRILKKAAELARFTDGTVIVLHVFSSSPMPESSKNINLQQLRIQSKKTLADIRYQFAVTSGEVSVDILQSAEDYSATEIVIGKRSHSVGIETTIGSVAGLIVRDSRLPVVVVVG